MIRHTRDRSMKTFDAGSPSVLEHLRELYLHRDPILRGAYTPDVAIHDERIQQYFDLRPAAETFAVDGPSASSREVSGHIVYTHRWEVEPWTG
jgi:hypothetical protein